MSEIGAGYYKGQDRDIDAGDIVAIVISITFGVPIIACLVYLIYVWVHACIHREEMERDGTIGDGFFWCWKSSSQVDLNVDQLVAAVPPVLPNGKVVDGAMSGGKGTGGSGSSTPTESDTGVELTSHHSTLPQASPRRQQQQQHGEVVIEVS